MMTGRGASFGLEAAGNAAGAELAAPDVFVLLAASSEATVAASIAEAAAKSAELKLRPTSSGMRMVEKKFRLTVSMAALTFCLGGAPSMCTSSLDQFPLKRASSE